MPSSYCNEKSSSSSLENSSSSWSPKKKCRRRQKKPNITVPETQLPEKPRRLCLSQPHSFSGESSSGNCLWHIRRSCNESAIEVECEDLEDVDVEKVQHVQVEDREEHIVQDGDQIDLQGVEGVEAVQSESVGTSTANSVQIPNAQPQKHQHIIPPRTESSAPDTEETYVEYCITHVQGGGDNPDQPSASIDGTYSLVANTLKLSTV